MENNDLSKMNLLIVENYYKRKYNEYKRRYKLIKSIINPRYGTNYCALDGYPKEIRAIFNYEDQPTKKHLRVTARVFRRLSSLIIRKNHGWQPEVELATLLFWLATGTSYRVVSLVMNMPKSTVQDIIKRLLDFVITELVHKVIKFPTSPEELNEIGLKFCQRSITNIFHNAVGAIDGTHVSIHCPVKLHNQYINRKLFYSIQLQAITDSSQKFLDVFVGYPGSVHDTRVLYNSPVYQKRLFPPQNFFLLGDSGYPCRMSPVAIVTPFKENGALSERQKQFNHRHSKARIVVECSFGQLKTRWRSIFNKKLELKIENCVKVAVACCVFHNVCMDLEDFVVCEPAVTINADLVNNEDNVDGTVFRQELLNNM